MGCIATVAAPDLIIIEFEDDPILGELVIEYNDFCKKTKEILKKVIAQSKRIDALLLKLFEDTKRSETISGKMLESFLNLILCILHYQRAKGEDTFNVMFSNYLPGILVEPQDLHEKIRLKYKSMMKLSKYLPEVVVNFNEMSKSVLDCINLSRNYYPKEFYKKAKGPPKFSVVKFAGIERDLMDNFEMIGKCGKLLDTMFKNSKDCIKVVLQVIDKCDANIDEVYKIFDGVDEWNYQTVPDIIQVRTLEFIAKTGIKVPLV